MTSVEVAAKHLENAIEQAARGARVIAAATRLLSSGRAGSEGSASSKG